MWRGGSHLRVLARELGEGDLAREFANDVDGVSDGVVPARFRGVDVGYDWLGSVDGYTRLEQIIVEGDKILVDKDVSIWDFTGRRENQ